MSRSNALAVSQKGVIAEIIERLAALTPEQFVEPEMPPDADYRAVGEAGDDIKRLFTLRSIILSEHKALSAPLKASLEKMEADMMAAKTNLEKVGMLQKLLAFANAPETLQLKAELSNKHIFYSAIDNIFWLEIRRQYPELSAKESISVRKNWTVGWDEESDEKGMSGIEVLFEKGDRPDLPDGFVDFLRSRFR